MFGVVGPQNNYMTKEDVLSDVNEKILKSKRVGHNTVRYFTDKEERLRYTNTDIVRITSHGIVLNTDGWHTMTTKAKLNDELARLKVKGYVWTEKGKWFLSLKDHGTYPFFDGIKVVKSSGKVLNPNKGKKEIDKNSASWSFVRKYCKQLSKELEKRYPNENGFLRINPVIPTEIERLALKDNRLFKMLTTDKIHGHLIIQSLKHSRWTDYRIERSYLPYARRSQSDCDYITKTVAKAVKKYLLFKFGYKVSNV